MMIEYKGKQYDPDADIGTGKASEIAGVCRRTMLYWCEKGYIPSTRRPGLKGQYVINTGELITIVSKPGFTAPENVAVAA